MKDESDQALARRHIEFRDKGYSVGLFLRKGIKGYLFLIAYFSLTLALFAFLQFWWPFCFMLGMLVGCLSRDLGWIRRTRMRWPFLVKVTDWEKVQRLADGPPS